ncbi:MAG: hypothetical protein Q8L02_04965 [Candidatus Nitrotoga sp.]|nr:hypothetical protein [Candidatus Nitrotoga sp.]
MADATLARKKVGWNSCNVELETIVRHAWQREKNRRMLDSMISSRFSTELKISKNGSRSVISGATIAMRQTFTGLKDILAYPELLAVLAWKNIVVRYVSPFMTLPGRLT